MTASENLDGNPLPFEISTNVDPPRSCLGYPTLAVRTSPLPDELLSSWLIRLAWLNAEKLHTFQHRFWLAKGSSWSHNVDLCLSEDALARIAQISGVQPATLLMHTLHTYAGVLFEGVDQRGGAQGLLCERRKGQRMFGFGLQFCPACLSGATIPYFRRWWRSAYFVACPEHKTLLVDACPRCHHSVACHLADFGATTSPSRLPTSFCNFCGLDWTTLKAGEYGELTEVFLDWQDRMLRALGSGWIENEGGCSTLYALSYFHGLRCILRLLSSGSRKGVRLREVVSQKLGLLPLETPGLGRKNLIGDVRLGDRFFMLRQAFWLLEDWPHRFFAALQEAGLSYSYIDQYRDGVALPYWIAAVASQVKDPRHIPIAREERESAKRFMVSRGMLPTANAIGRLLGRWYVSRKKAPRKICGVSIS